MQTGNSSIATIGTTLGTMSKSLLSFTDLRKKLQKAEEKRLKEVGFVIRQAYGEQLSDDEVLEIDTALRENRICSECEGECLKRKGKSFLNVIQVTEDGRVYIAVKPCKFEKTRMAERESARKIRLADIPSQFIGLTFNDYCEDVNNKKAKKIAEKLVEDGKKGAFFYGKCGVGKTMLAAIIANETIRRGRRVIFSKVPDLMRNIRSTFNKDTQLREFDVLEKIYKIPLLVLDDVRRDSGKKFVSDTLFDIVDFRYNAGLQTIMTSNGTLEEVCQALNNTSEGKTDNGTRIYDRCKTMMPPVEIGGESWRGRK